MVGFTKHFSKSAIFLILFISSTLLGMQRNTEPPAKPPTKVFVENADSTLFEKDNNPDIYVLMGNVRFRHDSTYLFCDSAYLYNTQNSLEAFGSVRIEQGDTLFMYGDYLIYEGNNSLAKMRHNVIMVNNDEVTLFTDSFNYDRTLNIGYYFGGGMIVDSLNELTSVYGRYSPDTKMAFFKDEVRLENPNFVLNSDTLEYSTETHIAVILGTSVIESDSGTIKSTRGWYDTRTHESVLLDRSEVMSKDGTKIIIADSLFYDKENGFMEAFGNMQLTDSVRKIILLGHYGFYNELTNFAFATDSSYVIEYSQQDSLFLYGDTLEMLTLDADREVKAFHNVRFYRTDLQGVCDSMQYNTADSLLYLYRNPVIWNTNYQINGDTIKVLFNDSTIQRVEVLGYAFSSEAKDSLLFNQTKGVNLYAYFDGGELSKIDIFGATESVYFWADEHTGDLTQYNKTWDSDTMQIWIEERRPSRIKWNPIPKGKMFPIAIMTDRYLTGFVNYDYLRPRNKDDIFARVVMREEDKPTPRRKRGAHLTQSSAVPEEHTHEHEHDENCDHDHEHNHDHEH